MDKRAYFKCAFCGQEYLADWYVTYRPTEGSQFSVAYTQKKFCSHKCSIQYAVQHQQDKSTD